MNNLTRKNTGAELLLPRAKADKPASTIPPAPPKPAYTRDVTVFHARGTPMRRVRLELDPSQLQKAKGYARKVNMTLGAFLDSVFGNRGPLGISARPEREPIRETFTGEHVRFECLDPDALARIQRCADYCGQTLAEYVADTVAAGVQGDEDDMISHPQSGEPVADRCALGDWVADEEWLLPKQAFVPVEKTPPPLERCSAGVTPAAPPLARHRLGVGLCAFGLVSRSWL